MIIAIAIRVTVLASALVLGTASIANAEPVRAANDEIVCFVHAIEPWKTDHGSMAPINYGFKVHCTGRPAMRSVTTKLWRYDAADGKWYKHAERIDTSTDPDVQALYSASCSSAGIHYGFHTQVEVTAIAGTWDDGGDNSATISAIC
ncbi:hypothetical protein [Nocardia gamkensis]|uniref:hypothetical protein n=1 Tax=Nocardia gamkensis TaxID=352869 RepID=UPI0037C9990C